jgi:hypothetical protein
VVRQGCLSGRCRMRGEIVVVVVVVVVFIVIAVKRRECVDW